jgi:hypothetical protein
MKKTELLNEIIRFNDSACNCRVIPEGKRVTPKYKRDSTLDTGNVDRAFSELGFRHIRVRKYSDEDTVWYMLGTEKMKLDDLIYDIACRFEDHSSVRKKLCSALGRYTEAEVSSFLDVTYAIVYELEVFSVKAEDIFGMTDEQKAMFGTGRINQFNSLLISYLLSEIHSNKTGSKVHDDKFLSDIYDYSFSMFGMADPFDMIGFGKRTANGRTVFGLKLKEKDITLADFLEDLSSCGAVDILYKKSYGSDKSYLAESLECAYYIALGLEADI